MICPVKTKPNKSDQFQSAAESSWQTYSLQTSSKLLICLILRRQIAAKKNIQKHVRH